MSIPVIDPTISRTKMLKWDMCIGALLVMIGIQVPFETAYLNISLNALFFFNRVIDFVFFLDMMLQFFLAFPDPQRPTMLVTDHKRIIKHYLGSWFLVDFISNLPVDVYCILVLDEEGMDQGMRTVRVVKFFRLVRLLRLVRFIRLVERWHTSIGFSFASLSLLKFLGTTASCCHWIACMWGAMAMHNEAGERTWLTALKEAKGGPDELYENPFQVYSISLYWAIVTLTSIGYGDITPQTLLEYWTTSLCTSIAASLWAYVIGAVCSIVSSLDPHEMSHRRTMDDLNWLLVENAVPQHMCQNFRRYFHETREISRQKVEKEVIAQMSPKLQGEFAHFMHKRWIRKAWYLRSMPYEMVVFLSRSLDSAVFSPNEWIITERTLCIIRRGVAALSGKILVSGDVWGEDMLLSNEVLRRKDPCRSLSYLSVLKLHISELVEIAQNFPEARARLRYAQVQIAMCRAVKLISEASKELQRKDAEKFAQVMTLEGRAPFITHVLAGRFPGNLEDDVGFLGIDRFQTNKQATEDPFPVVETPRNGGGGSPVSAQQVATLVEKLEWYLNHAAAQVPQAVTRTRFRPDFMRRKPAPSTATAIPSWAAASSNESGSFLSERHNPVANMDAGGGARSVSTGFGTLRLPFRSRGRAVKQQPAAAADEPAVDA